MNVSEQPLVQSNTVFKASKNKYQPLVNVNNSFLINKDK